MTDKLRNFEWACAKLRDAVEDGTYGTLTFSMQNGVIGNAKTEVVSKPPVDNNRPKI